jgi:hypothetical protein
MSNEIYLVGRRQSSTSGATRRNIRGFDYKDESSGLTICVRSDADWVVINDRYVRITDLKEYVKSYKLEWENETK